MKKTTPSDRGPRRVAATLCAVLTAVLAVATGACQRSADSPTHVVLISIDTCRADRLSCYGYHRQSTPSIDRLARDGVVFDEVVAPAPLTLPAHCSMMTGMLPPAHGVRNNFGYRLGAEATTLAERFRSAGWHTGAVVGAFVLDSVFGMDQGFDTYQDRFASPRTPMGVRERQADESARLAIEWLREHRDGPGFLFLHFFDPHRSYEPPEPYRSEYAGDPYTGEIAFVDHWIGQVVETLRSLGRYHSSVIVVTGDHGEMLGEHGEETHGYFVYQSAMRVPLVIKPVGRDAARGTRVGEPVSLVDIAPTLCAAAGLEWPGSGDGEDLSGRLTRGRERAADSGRTLYVESLVPTLYGGNPLHGAISWPWKYIHSLRPELYDLGVDPGETHNLALSAPAVVRDLASRLATVANGPAVAPGGNDMTVDARASAQLQALGYVLGKVEDPGLERDAERPDAKDMIHVHNSVSRVLPLIETGRYDEAERLCREILRELPEFADAHLSLGRIAADTGRLEEAEQHVRRALEIVPDLYEGLNNLGIVLLRRDRADEAEETLRRAIALEPERLQAFSSLGSVLLELGQLDEAAASYRRVLDSDPDTVVALNGLALAEQRRGNLADAESLLRRALERDPGQAEVRLNMGRLLLELDRPGDAESMLSALVADYPSSFEAHRWLAHALHRLGELHRASDTFLAALELTPRDVGLAHEAATCAWQAGRAQLAIRLWHSVLSTDGNHVEALNAVAWALATHSDATIRDPDRAAAFAGRACSLSGYRNASYLDTLAVALAANGEFQRATEIARRARDAASRASDEPLVAEITQRLELFETKRPYRAAP